MTCVLYDCEGMLPQLRMVHVWISMLATTQTMRLEPPRVQVAMQGSIVKMMLLNVLTVVLAHIR